MATKNTACRDAQVTNLAGLFNRLDIRTAGGAAVLATFTITWGTAATGVISESATWTTTASGTGTAAEARLYNSTPDSEISGITVGVAAEDIVLDDVTITTGQTVNITSFDLTEPAATA